MNCDPGTYRWDMSVKDDDVLVSLQSQLTSRAQTKDTGPDDDYLAVEFHICDAREVTGGAINWEICMWCRVLPPGKQDLIWPAGAWQEPATLKAFFFLQAVTRFSDRLHRHANLHDMMFVEFMGIAGLDSTGILCLGQVTGTSSD